MVAYTVPTVIYSGTENYNVWNNFAKSFMGGNQSAQFYMQTLAVRVSDLAVTGVPNQLRFIEYNTDGIFPADMFLQLMIVHVPPLSPIRTQNL